MRMRLIAADVEVAHQPAQRPVGLRKVGEVLHEQDQRREERVHRDAGEQQHVGRQPAVPGARQRVDDGDGSKRADEAGGGRRRDPSHANDQPNVIASMAPSAAPAETPSVNGVASGLRKQPLEHDAGAPRAATPTSAPASVRGSRATKKICASTLSANGMAGSNARRRLMCVEPTSGAITIATSASSPKPVSVIASRPPSGARRHCAGAGADPAHRDHDQPARRRRAADVGLDAVEIAG